MPGCRRGRNPPARAYRAPSPRPRPRPGAAGTPAGRSPWGYLSIGALLVDGRVGVEQQCDQVLDLLLGQDAVLPEPRHVGARRIRLGVVDFRIGVSLGGLARAARL